MKIRFHKERPVDVNCPCPPSFLHSSFRLHPSPQRGIALVITLIMLSVTLVMAVAFLAVSNRERDSVSTSTDSNHARLAADSALANAEAQIMANILSTTNPYNFGLLVSTNYINRFGFVETIASPTNVNYDYLSKGGGLTQPDLVQNIANLEYLPRAPVYVPNNSASGYDFRYYLDLNRNGMFDDTFASLTNWQRTASGVVQNQASPFISEIGDPQWIGVLEHPDAPHGPLNRFIARYCFIAVPVGNTLDVNAIYNDAAAIPADLNSSRNMLGGSDAFLRNEGVGSWELNLAAFLADLNTNEWDAPGSQYSYRTPLGLGLANSGFAFQDAFSLLSYRYNYNTYNQTNVTQFGNYGTLGFNAGFNYIDEFSAGPLMTNLNLPPAGYNIGYPWPGSGNTNLFFSLSDIFNPALTEPNGPVGFTDRLLQAGTNTYGVAGGQVPTYDRYTFYRMLSQLGSDSAPEYGKINLNYNNVDANGNVVPGAETNFIPWTPLQFFTTAADHMLKLYTTNWYNGSAATIYINGVNGATESSPHYYFTNDFGGTNVFSSPNLLTGQPFGLTNIPVWVNGRFVYTSAVNRLLQLAANIYDSTTPGTNYPSVFRPTFARDNVTGNIFISGYTNVTYVNGINDPVLTTPVNISALVLGNIPPGGSGLTVGLNNVNVYGVPWIIGAKKGLPSFNELYTLNNVQVTRKMEVVLPAGNGTANNTTNKQYIMGITNLVGMSFWNSYRNNYYGSGNLTLYMQDTMSVALTNGTYSGANLYTTPTIYTFTTNMTYWPGSAWPGVPTVQANPNSFISVVFTNVFLSASAYDPGSGGFINLAQNPSFPTNIPNYQFPQLGLLTTNSAQAFLLDGVGSLQHVVDYVQFGGPYAIQNVATNLADVNPMGMWTTNGYGKNSTPTSPTFGEVDQIMYSLGDPLAVPASESWYSGTIPPPQVAQQQAQFRAFIIGAKSYNYSGANYQITEVEEQTPYVPQRLMSYYTLLEANDPLVHYTTNDLNYISPGSTGLQRIDNGATFPALPGLTLNQPAARYQPWGLAGQMVGLANLGVDINSNNLAYRDPLVWGSDNWQFPTNFYPTVGWLGRVHRGTPWQTVFLKSTNLMYLYNAKAGSMVSGLSTWQVWTGNNGNSFDATNASPAYDRWLFDLFTTAPSDNATLGQLSVNQTHLAAWSAVFSGVPVYTNSAGTNLFVQPAGVNGTNYNLALTTGIGTNYMGYIWNSIQQTRSNTNLFPQQVFGHLGDILATPALSDASPFLQGLNGVGVNDEMYEWLPQQTLSLLKLGTPRYVVYCYGQALKPAPNGIMAGGNFPLMCTNYQIVAESAVRAVVEVENPNSPNPRIVIKNINPLPADQ